MDRVADEAYLESRGWKIDCSNRWHAPKENPSTPYDGIPLDKALELQRLIEGRGP